jgi:hypothetical protein
MAVRIQIQQAMLTIVLLGGAVTLVAEQPCPSQFQNIRTKEPDVRLAVASCFERSITCRGLIETIEASTTIVYVKTGWCRSTRPSSCLNFMANGVEVYRYLRVTLDPALRGDTVIAVLGHELQHAVEIVRAPEVTGTDTMRALFERIGYRLQSYSGLDEFETVEARHIKAVIWDELRQGRKALLEARH